MTYSVIQALLAASILTMPAVVAMAAADQGVDVDRALACVQAESAWDPAAVGDDGMAVGLWQFWPETWTWAAELTGHPEWRDPGNRLDPVKSTIVALDMIGRGWGHLWTGWR